MAAKTKKNKLTRIPQYEAILKEQGLTMKDVHLIGFRFPDISSGHAFHYAIIGKLGYIMYDGATEKVKILTQENVESFKEIAAMLGGEYYSPTILNDYE